MSKYRSWLPPILFGLSILLMYSAYDAGKREVHEELTDSYDASLHEKNPESAFMLVDQVIVTGPKDAVTTVVKALNNAPGATVGLALNRYVDLMRFDVDPDLLAPTSPFSAADYNELTIRLYDVEDKGVGSITNLVALINTASATMGLPVFADPNYLVSPGTELSACGNPTYEGGGSPSGAFAGANEVNDGLFYEQWAFDRIGAFSDSRYEGEGVLIGVFDTSPYPETTEEELEPLTISIGWPDQTGTPVDWDLKVSYPYIRELAPVGDPSDDEPPDVSDHGLFVAGLIRAVVPKSDIRLIRVLNKYGCGALYDISEALVKFVEGVEAEDKQFDGTVINLSLGVLRPDLAAVMSGEPDEDFIEIAGSVLEGMVDPRIESLHSAVVRARSSGAVVVAAAGNDSGVEDDNILLPQLPAAFPFVIGVAGSNIDGARACFSNLGALDDEETEVANSGAGGVSAPSGDFTSVVDSDLCDTRDLEECPVDCSWAVIGPARPQPAGGASQVEEGDFRYAYWRGTSFSAPLVSGLAARVFDAGVSEDDDVSQSEEAWRLATRVIGAIDCGASTGDFPMAAQRVISMPLTLSSECMQP